MIGKGQRPTKLVLFALVILLALPVVALADKKGRGRGKPTDVFVNGHDARDGRRDKDKRKNKNARRNRDYDGDRDYDDDDDSYRRRRRDRYGDGRDGNDGYYNNELRQTALNAGYNEGVDEGRKDRERGERFEYHDEGDYQKATKDYSSRLGDRELYRRYFREGFANGYREGYENGYYGRDDDRRGVGIGDILGGILGRP